MNSKGDAPPWLKLKPIRSRTLIEHSSPDTRQFTEEIALINQSSETVKNFPLTLPEFRDGLKVLDEDSSTLSFYSRSEIVNIIKNYTPRLKSAIEEQLNSDKAFLLWISLPKSKEIKQNELRTIKLVFYSTRKQMEAEYSSFSIAEYIEKLSIPGIGKGPEYFYFITAPPDYAIEVVQKETYTKEVSHETWFRTNKKLLSYYWSFQPDTDENAKQSYMTIVNPHNTYQ